MPDINTVSVTFENGVKREEYGPTKKAAVTITAAVDTNEDGAAVLDQISYIAANKVAALLSIAGTAAPSVAAAPADPPSQSDQAAGATQQPQVRSRRTKAEMEAARAAEAAGSQSATTEPQAAEATQQVDTPAPAGDEWDAPAPVHISDGELTQACSEASTRCNDPAKVRSLKEPYNPAPGQPFTFSQIPQEHRAAVMEKLKAL